MTSIRLSHVAIVVADLHRAIEFVQTSLDGRLIRETVVPDAPVRNAFVEIGDGNLIELVQLPERAGERRAHQVPLLPNEAILVLEADDAAGAAEAMRSRGVHSTTLPASGSVPFSRVWIGRDEGGGITTELLRAGAVAGLLADDG